ncbi:MAG: hypothetical protein ACOCVX_01745 [Bacteroidales bacterium]
MKMKKTKYLQQILYTLFILFLGAIVNDIYPDLKTALINIFNTETLWDGIKTFFTIKIDAPLWLLLFLCLIIIVVLIIKAIRIIKTGQNFSKLNFQLKRLSSKKDNKTQKNLKLSSLPSFKPQKADQKLNVNLNSRFLGSEKGVFSIWAYVSDVHNKKTKEFKYIISYATNKGKEFGNPELARYPNAWAICRVTPTDRYPKGIWRFFCNNVTKEQVRIEMYDTLNSGWHLFSVAWSKKGNYIKFIIDKDIVGVEDFENWPSDFSESIRIGTWPTKSPSHYFESKIGYWQFVESEFHMQVISEYWNKKTNLI